MKPSAPVPSFGQATTYRGVVFKSRCEARWAALIDLVCLGDWEYEPNGESTFPDFSILISGHTLLLEIKGALHADPSFGSRDDWQEWTSHPDAVKARRSCAELLPKRVIIGCGDGYLMVRHESVVWDEATPEAREKMEWPDAWKPALLRKQTKYDWPRAAAMVNGGGVL